jgi:replication-associated recombination protein RarA
MKLEKMSEIKNVTRAQKTLQVLLTRPRSELVGLGLIYGAPGLGKTRFAKRTAFSRDYIYFQLEATMNQRSFLKALLKTLQTFYSVPAPIKGNRHALFEEVREILLSAPDPVIFIDEIDYAFRDKQLLGTIRDLVDTTTVTIMLFGMQDAYHSLLKANAHYFDRCNAFCEFKTLSYDDTKLICQDVSDVEMSDEAIRWTHDMSKGTIRNIIKNINFFEQLAKAKGLKVITAKEIPEWQS